jgi:hypothetical protein
LAALALAAKRRLRDFDPQNIVNTAWAFAKMKCRAEELFAALAIAEKRRIS